MGFKDINLELTRIMVSNHIGEMTAISSIYETAPWGVSDQATFLNQALICFTELNAVAVLDQIHLIENKMGRIRMQKWGARIIDIDIIFYGDEIVENHNLKIPHSELTNRNFVLLPLLEICPEKVHPLLNKSIEQLAKECKDTGKVAIYK